MLLLKLLTEGAFFDKNSTEKEFLLEQDPHYSIPVSKEITQTI